MKEQGKYVIMYTSIKYHNRAVFLSGGIAMEIKEIYQRWLENANDDQDLIKELEGMKDDDIYESFYRELKFGTAGLRGIIGAGTNRMNIYTVRRATQGLANALNKNYESSSVAISFDSRIKGFLFAKEAARVLAANGIKVYISKELQPTPVVSFAVRELGAKAGIMITASHNPAKYNGYKCYGDDGCQMTDVNAGKVYDEIVLVLVLCKLLHHSRFTNTSCSSDEQGCCPMLVLLPFEHTLINLPFEDPFCGFCGHICCCY